MAEEDTPPAYQGVQRPFDPFAGPKQSVLVKLIQHSPGDITPSSKGRAESMLPSRQEIRRRNDAISIPTTISEAELTNLLWQCTYVHFGVDVMQDYVPPPGTKGELRGFGGISVQHGDDRVGIVDEAAWEAAKEWCFCGAGSLRFIFALAPVVLHGHGKVEDDKEASPRPSVAVQKEAKGKDGKNVTGRSSDAGEEHKKCVVQ